MGKISKVLTVAGVAVATSSVLAVVAPASAQAAFGACYVKGSYSFKNDSATSQINVYSGSSCGTQLGWVWASKVTGTTKIGLRVRDTRCDSVGITLRVHGHSVPSDGCNTTVLKEVQSSSIGSPRNMWAYVAGTTNSNTVNLP